MAVYVFQNSGWPPSWIFAEVKFEGISVSGTFVFVSVNVCNCDWVMAIKLNFQSGGRRHLGFCRGEIWHPEKSPLTRIYLHTIFGEDILKGGRVMTIYVFLKWRPAAILDFQWGKIWRYFCFQDGSFSLWAKFRVYMCNSDWVMAIKVNFQNGGRRHLEFCQS